MNRFLIGALVLITSISAHTGLALASESAVKVSQAFRGSPDLELSVLLFGTAIILIPILLVVWALKSIKPPRK